MTRQKAPFALCLLPCAFRRDHPASWQDLVMASRHCNVLMTLLLTVAAAATAAELQQSDTSSKVRSDTEALRAFDNAVQRYVTLRSRVGEELPELKVTDDPAEIVRTSDALARAITRARVNARQGEFFTPAIAIALRSRLRGAAQKTNFQPVIAPGEDEQTTLKKIQIHARFPLDSAMATMPTTALDVLPVLPKGLEYRFIGTTLILRDVEAALIIDFMPNAFR
jgi:hypothetical protein